MQNVQVVSFIPGRVRLKVADLESSAEFAARVQNELTTVSAIHSVEIKPGTGSVLVKYDPLRVANPASLNPLCEKLKALFPDIDVERIRRWLAS